MTGLPSWRDYESQVRGYLRDCRRVAAELKLRGSGLENHPSAAGAAKLIFGDAKLIKLAYDEVTGDGSDEKAA